MTAEEAASSSWAISGFLARSRNQAPKKSGEDLREFSGQHSLPPTITYNDGAGAIKVKEIEALGQYAHAARDPACHK